MIDYIIEGICVLFCLLHFMHSLYEGRKVSRLSKKIDTVCEKCGLSVSDCSCDLSEAQLNALYDFVLSLRGVDNGNSK